MRSRFLLLPVLCGALVCGATSAPSPRKLEWNAGVASVIITPKTPLPMAGYAARTEPAEGTETELFATALAIEHREGQRVVFLTMDIIGIRTELRSAVAQTVLQTYGLPAHALVMSASHTHCGPAYERNEAKEYTERLVKTLTALVGTALNRLEPALLAYAHARCGFAMNRRTPTAAGFRNHPNPDGVVDHDVPVLRVADAGGKLRSVVFGYACHNTTMGFRRWLGDYAGYAKAYLEEDLPGVAALFMMGCGADQNPYPRRKLDYADRHGRSLATAVEAALEIDQATPRHQRVLHGPLRTVLDTVDLAFTTEGRAPYAYPVQVVRFGKELLMIALGNEVVVDYALRLKRECAAADGPSIWVAAYTNSYPGYIPSRRVLAEGGYEAESRPWKSSLEERIVKKVHELCRSAMQDTEE